MIEDLETAKRKLLENNLTLVVVKDSKVLYESRSKGVFPFLEALEKLGNKMRNTSVADKIVGKAIALLCIYAKVRAVYASILSLKAKQALENYEVHLEWDKLVEKILDTSMMDICPFEKVAIKINDPKDAYRKFKTLLTLKNDVKRRVNKQLK